eukprot:Sspe_Gene.38278::Locus_18451_Transcript_4_5_Confidence_0.455_Length_1577::g.38278::m.38278
MMDGIGPAQWGGEGTINTAGVCVGGIAGYARRFPVLESISMKGCKVNFLFKKTKDTGLQDASLPKETGSSPTYPCSARELSGEELWGEGERRGQEGGLLYLLGCSSRRELCMRRRGHRRRGRRGREGG